ncbi:MAG: hypothetical protein HOM61_04440, partial [Candidatus Marinimicrobia bacterium]|nr:hypothetical protein [Candidatus Neomarinimicrobiota bacterium]
MKIKDMNISIIINRALSFIALFVFISDFAFSQLSTIDTKCLWIVRDSMKNKEEVDSALVHAYEAGYD